MTTRLQPTEEMLDHLRRVWDMADHMNGYPNDKERTSLAMVKTWLEEANEAS